MQLTPSQIDDSFAAVQAVFRQVRPLLVKNAGKIAHTGKHDGSPVTDIDIEVENIVLAELGRKFPGMPVLGEETGYDDARTGAAWLLDPIDGTKSFIQNIPAYTCMAVLIQNDEAIATVIYNPAIDAMYTARKGQGAYKNGARLDLRATPLPTRAFCRGRLVDSVATFLKPIGIACEPGPTGAGYGFSQVAEGTVAARFNFPHTPGGGYIHDYAPGALLVCEAGGAIIPIGQEVYTYKTRSFVACHPELEALVRQHAQYLHKLEVQTAK